LVADAAGDDAAAGEAAVGVVGGGGRLASVAGSTLVSEALLLETPVSSDSDFLAELVSEALSDVTSTSDNCSVIVSTFSSVVDVDDEVETGADVVTAPDLRFSQMFSFGGGAGTSFTGGGVAFSADAVFLASFFAESSSLSEVSSASVETLRDPDLLGRSFLPEASCEDDELSFRILSPPELRLLEDSSPPDLDPSFEVTDDRPLYG